MAAIQSHYSSIHCYTECWMEESAECDVKGPLAPLSFHLITGQFIVLVTPKSLNWVTNYCWEILKCKDSCLALFWYIMIICSPSPLLAMEVRPSSVTFIYTGCHRRKGPNFGRVFLMLNYTDVTQNTYIQSWTVMEIMAREVWNFDSCYTLTDCQIHIETGRNVWFL